MIKMELLGVIKEEDIFEDCVKQPDIDYKLRMAPRAVLFDGDKIALLYVGKYNYYKLPGGGKKSNESLEDALKRECLEECGCNIEIIREIGQIIEYKDRISQKHETFCFLAKVVGKKGEQSLEEDEKNSEYKLLWVDLDKAIELMTNTKPQGGINLDDGDSVYFAQFIVKRELIYLMKAKELLNEQS